MLCPNCGQSLPKSGTCYNCIKNETDAKHYGSGTGTLPAFLKYGYGGSGKRIVDHGPMRIKRDRIRREEKLTLTAVRAVLPKRPLSGTALAHQRQGVNKFLKAVFGQQMLISNVLRRRGYNGHQIAEVRRHVSEFLALYLTTLYKSWNLILTPRQILLIAHYYSLNGNAPQNQGDLANELKMPVDCVQLDLQYGMNKLRLPHNKRHIDRTIHDTARKVLEKSGSGIRSKTLRGR